VFFPYDTEKEFATKGKVPVKATFNGAPYTGSLIKYRNPLHMRLSLELQPNLSERKNLVRKWEHGCGIQKSALTDTPNTSYEDRE